MFEQLALFPSIAKPTTRTARTQSRLNAAQRRGVRETANVAFFEARREAFRTLSRERGGYTARTKDGIDAESLAAGNHAREQVYLRAGYHYCPGESCDRLASPGFVFCPNCAPGGPGR